MAYETTRIFFGCPRTKSALTKFDWTTNGIWWLRISLPNFNQTASTFERRGSVGAKITNQMRDRSYAVSGTFVAPSFSGVARTSQATWPQYNAIASADPNWTVQFPLSDHYRVASLSRIKPACNDSQSVEFRAVVAQLARFELVSRFVVD